ncbi:acylphosphatase [Gloeocapsopsis sp. IPPAS B-1203]|uniref:acylphosphatase n=1 Tax=Gloeocapsopsis sp. IPPAS B-1203 TaxID=2049454 RepID=UPI0025A0E69B|nr:acylphosphatase [Gloeocapsopsis sp. IPPAS B-1203]
MPILKRLHITIQGTVQGVGFRPFIYRLATELGLVGWVNNFAGGVAIEVEGSQTQLQAFYSRFTKNCHLMRRSKVWKLHISLL